MQRMRDKYRLVIVNEDTFEDHFNVRLSRLNVFIILGTVILILTVLTFLMIAYTPLKEYIPGFANVHLNQRIIYLQNKVDSLTYYANSNEKYIHNLKLLIEGKTLNDTLAQNDEKPGEKVNYDTIEYHTTPEDSILRAEYEKENAFNLYFGQDKKLIYNEDMASGVYFFPPLKGIIVKPFEPAEHHLACDIVAPKQEPIKAIYDGTVLFSDWTLPTGYVIIIQHPFNYISMYKHNAVLLKKQGEHVKAGEPVAIIGESGEISTGPHLHFELWRNGIPINPEDYITF